MMKSVKNKIFLFLALFCYLKGWANDSENLPKYRFFQAIHNQAHIVGNKDAPLSSNHSWGFDARVGWYSDEKNATYADSLFHYPSFGLGMFYGNLNGIHLGENGNYADLGRSVALYGFFKCPITRMHRSELNWLVGFGASGGHGTWNAKTNPYNTITSTFLNYFILLGAEYRYIVTDKSSLGIGLSLRHSSNAAFRLPNRGLNLFSVDMSYRFDESGNFDRRYTLLPRKSVGFPLRWDWSLSVGYGLQQLEKGNRLPTDRNTEYHFSNVTLSSRVMCQFFRKRKFGIGLDFFYSEAGSYLEQVFFEPKKTGIPVKKPERDYLSQQLNGAFVLSHEYGFNKLWIVTDFGFYFKPFNAYTIERKRHTYERAGLKYRFSERFYTALFVRAHALAAVHAEYTLGMYLRK